MDVDIPTPPPPPRSRPPPDVLPLYPPESPPPPYSSRTPSPPPQGPQPPQQLLELMRRPRQPPPQEPPVVQQPPPPQPDVRIRQCRRAIYFCAATVTLGVLFVFFAIIMHKTHFANIKPTAPTPTRRPQPTPPPLYMPESCLQFTPDAAKALNSTWHQGNLLHLTQQRDLVLYNVANNTAEMIIHWTDTKRVISYVMSADGQFVLLERLQRQGMHVFYAVYAVNPLGLSHLASRELSSLGYLEMALFGPTGSQMVFVQMNNIYYKSSAHAVARQITFSGSSRLTNGIADWAYAEYFFYSRQAMWFSPDGRFLAWLSFDDIQDVMYELYPPTLGWRRAAGDHGVVKLNVVRLAEPYVRHVSVVPEPEQLDSKHGDEAIVTAVHWTPDSNLVIVWMNRHQNEAYVQVCTTYMTCQLITVLTSPNGWVRVPMPLHTRSAEYRCDLALIQPVRQVGKQAVDTYYNQIVLYALKPQFAKSDEVIRPLHGTDTTTVQSILYWDSGENVIFFLGNRMQRPEERQLFAIFADKINNPACLTCYARYNSSHSHFDARFEVGTHSLQLAAEGSSAPKHSIVEWHINEQTDGTKSVSLRAVSSLNVFGALRESLWNVSLPMLRYETVRLPRPGQLARVKLLLPRSFGTCDGSRMFPLLVRPYEGPSTFAGASTWKLDWDTYYAANRSVVVAYIDASGSDRMTVNQQHAVYGRLGWKEAEDVLFVTQQLLRRLPCLDKQRVGLKSSGYGGYVVGMTMIADHDDIFKCGYMKAPIADWMLYSALFVERYMGGFNSKTYANSSFVRSLDSLKRKMKATIQLVHAEQDHDYEMSTRLAKTMSNAGFRVEEQDYTRDPRLALPVINNYFDRCFLFANKHVFG